MHSNMIEHYLIKIILAIGPHSLRLSTVSLSHATSRSSKSYETPCGTHGMKHELQVHIEKDF